MILIELYQDAMLLVSLRQFWLNKWDVFVHSTTRNEPYVHLRLDSILEFSQTFLIIEDYCSLSSKEVDIK